MFFPFGRMGLTNVAAMGGGLLITITSTSIAENTAIGTAIGTLSVNGGSGTYTFSITADPDAKFQIGGVGNDELQVAGALDYETATSHSVTIQADNGVDAPISRVFTISVTDVAEANIYVTAYLSSLQY